MRRQRARRATILTAALAFAMATGTRAEAAGWELRDFRTPLGDKGHALSVASKRAAGVRLAIACDGDTGTRWRGVAVVEQPDSKAGLGMSGDVRIRFGETSTRDRWEVKATDDEHRIYTAAEPTRFARRLLREEAASAAAEVTIEIPGVGGKPVALTFPLAGLKAKIGQIAARCADWELEEQE